MSLNDTPNIQIFRSLFTNAIFTTPKNRFNFKFCLFILVFRVNVNLKPAAMAEDGQLTRAQMTRLAKKDAVMKMTKSIQYY
jgi:hypothetical protein